MTSNAVSPRPAGDGPALSVPSPLPSSAACCRPAKRHRSSGSRSRCCGQTGNPASEAVSLSNSVLGASGAPKPFGVDADCWPVGVEGRARERRGVGDDRLPDPIGLGLGRARMKGAGGGGDRQRPAIERSMSVPEVVPSSITNRLPDAIRTMPLKASRLDP